ncbi:hypothetical protein K488DRAFT_86422 [Vararia minispora EC-137]|uniref:Uncharacterized protein n=1 Tax=Vararia minispora EC-137 TaxID=1314806 RepID=A0ACB8QJ83_9AGAM|nr:hypothetical protein K488DRAFT_86422 [Vararia minispora EC-137]
MSMDRKNKKAAQAANAAAGGKESGRGKAKGHGERGGRGSSNALLSGSTAPTRILQGGSTRAPMPMALKATISPSAPAPPLKDTDFAALGMPDEETKLPSAPATRRASALASGPSDDTTASPRPDEESSSTQLSPSHSPLPSSTPSQPVRINDSTTSAELGPIGSPRSASSQELPKRVNGFSPATSPSRATGFLSTSPFSAPGTQSVFYSEQSELPARSGIAASLGATRSWAEYGRLPAGGVKEGAGDVVVVEEDLEELIPGSLSDLLTPEERSRRYSRTVAPNSAGLAPGMASPSRESAWGAGPRPSIESHHHRYSRSVPAPTLLGDIKSIWSDDSKGQPPPVGSPRSSAMERAVTTGQVPGLGTPSSFKSSSAFGGRSYAEDHVSAFLSPSNASAAFLPGAHFLGAKGMQRTSSGGLRSGTYVTGPSANAANLLARLNEPIPPHSAGHARTQFDGASESYNGQPFQLGGRPGELDDRHGMSPSALALQAHAPGQSLPQGLAAGYSRIHALPPPPVISSPSASSAFVPSQPGTFTTGTSFTGPPTGPGFGDWLGMSPGKGGVADHMRAGLAFDTVPPGRLSYSNTVSAGRPGAAPPAAVRTPSGKSWVTPTSPLSRPVATDEEEPLFDLE